MHLPEAFFTLHRDLPREGPGLPEDVAWVAARLDTARVQRILDGASGPGSDIATLLTAFSPESLHAADWMEHFIAQVEADFGDDPRVTATRGDMFEVPGPFDLIWCAGAIYFAGVAQSLRRWSEQLAEDGVIAFSAPCYFDDEPSDIARALWATEGDIPTRTKVFQEIADAGFALIASRPLSDAAWEAYYGPQLARVAQLWPDADAALRAVLDEARQEAAVWRAAKDETGYELCVVRRA
ncbi:MAG: class I SAM-dependent methyltransferase [Pseudomonadota bacterium]